MPKQALQSVVAAALDNDYSQRGDEMLTIRLNQDGIIRVFQTGHMVMRLNGDNKALERAMHLVQVDRPGEISFSRGNPQVISTRDAMDEPPHAALIINRRSDGDECGVMGESHFICLYAGDTARVIDGGATILEWPEKAKS